MAIKFEDKGSEKPAGKASVTPPPAPPRATEPAPTEEPEAEPQLPFAKAIRPEKKRKGK